MKYMTSPNQGASSTVLRMFYMQAIRSIIEYAAPCISTASHTCMEELEKMQNTHYDSSLGPPNGQGYAICKLKLTSLPNETANLFHLQKFIKENPKLHLNINQAFQQDPTLFTKKTCANQIAGGIKELGVQQLFFNLEMDPPDDTYRTPPPWQGKAVKTTTHRLSHTKNKLIQKEALRQATETIQAAPRQGV